MKRCEVDRRAGTRRGGHVGGALVGWLAILVAGAGLQSPSGGTMAGDGAGEEAAAARLDETAKAVRKEAAALDERDASGQRELRAQLLEQAKRLDGEIRRKHDELAAMLERAVEELRTEKADRSAVAAILHEVAMRLTDDLPIPLSGGGGT